MTTKITPSVLANTAVTAGSYGGASVSPSITVDAQGRVTGAGNNAINIDTSQLTSGTLADVRLPGQASLTASAYNGNTNTAIAIVTDAKGRVKSIANVPIQITTAQITGYPTFVSSATTDTTNATNIITGTLDAARLAISGVGASTYGAASSVSQVTVDAKGRITTASNVAIAITSSAVSGLAASATTDTTNATNISSGTLAAARLADSGVTASTYGSASSVSQFVVDSKGRITSAANVAITISGGAVSGKVSAATTADSATSAALASKASTLSQGGGNGTAMTFNYSAQTGQPTYLWGTNDGTNINVYNPSNFSVNYATSAGSATTAGSAGSVAWTNVSGRPTSLGDFTAVATNVQQFNSSGTWTKPTGGQTMAHVQMWNGGNGGGSSSFGGGPGYGTISSVQLSTTYGNSSLLSPLPQSVTNFSDNCFGGGAGGATSGGLGFASIYGGGGGSGGQGGGGGTSQYGGRGGNPGEAGQVPGGGGSGQAGYGAPGGQGGNYAVVTLPLSYFAGTAAITVGSGGAGGPNGVAGGAGRVIITSY